jgi:hypothetical protein
MNKKEAEKIVSTLDQDDRMDLIMYLAECFDYRVFDTNMPKDITYFLETGTKANSYEELDLLLSQNGWVLECYSPLEISEKDNSESRATGYAAEMIIKVLNECDPSY